MSAAVRAAIVALVETVDAIGKVHAYQRFAGKNDDLRSLYTVDGEVRGWHVQRVSARRRRLGSGRELVTSTWAVTGFLSFVDAEASELVMDGLVEEIVSAERADPTLGGLVRGLPVDEAAGFQLLDAAPVMFAGLLCHRARLSLFTQEISAAQADDGDFPSVDGAAGRLVGAVVERLAQATEGFGAIEGRLAFDPDDDPAAFPAAIVALVNDQARVDPTFMDLSERVELRLSVTIVGRAQYLPGAEGALAAGGLEALAENVRTALHGWQPAQVDVPFCYLAAAPVEAAPGLFAWRLTFTPAIYIEDQANG